MHDQFKEGGGEVIMRVFELAQKLKVTETYIHSIIRALKATKGMNFTRKGWQYELTPKEVRAIVKEIERRKRGATKQSEHTTSSEEKGSDQHERS